MDRLQRKAMQVLRGRGGPLMWLGQCQDDPPGTFHVFDSPSLAAAWKAHKQHTSNRPAEVWEVDYTEEQQ